MGSIGGHRGTKIPHAEGQVSPLAATRGALSLQLESLCDATKDPACHNSDLALAEGREQGGIINSMLAFFCLNLCAHLTSGNIQ